MWVGTDGGGLSRLDGENFINLPGRGGLLNGGVLSLHEDAAGDLWVGALGALVQIRRARVLRVYTKRDGLSGNSVRAIVGDAGGRLWVGTNDGLNKLENGRLARLTMRDGMSSENVRALHVDRAGDLWIGTIGGGLDLLRDGEFTHYTTAQGMPSNGVRSIFEDKDGTLWIGTDGGLVRLRGGKITAYTSAVGMFDDTVMGVVEDGKGNFWMASNKGIFRTSKRGLEDFAAGRASRITGEVFGTADGMLSAECNGVSQPSAIRARDGRLWFATVSGAAVVDPRRLGAALPPPPVVIENMVVDDEQVKDAAGYKLAPGAQRIEFHYTGLSFIAPERVRFRYRLDGFDRDWVEAGTRRAAYYTNLPPGRYRFQVAAANGDGVWNAESKSIEFEVRPHFFQTRWFYALCAAATLALAWGLYLLRVRRIRRQFALVLAERTRVAREMHDTLIQGVVGASTVLEAVSGMLPRTTSPAYGYLERAREQLRQSLDDARRAVWDLRNPAAQTQDLATALRQTVESLAAGASA
ncbi:MAG: histidine kinase, partial [Planctomycetota bacterium]|nr:histidine kinase [Planctomycetota bacterium]